jgi:hypothetical protein
VLVGVPFSFAHSIHSTMDDSEACWARAESSSETLMAVCREGRTAEVAAAVAALQRWRKDISSSKYVAEAASANHADVVYALYQIVHGRLITNPTLFSFLKTVARKAGCAGHGKLLLWALRTMRIRGVFHWTAFDDLNEDLGAAGRLDMLRLLESDSAAADSAAADVIDHGMALKGACRTRQVAVVRWVLNYFESKEALRVRTLWNVVAAMGAERVDDCMLGLDATIWRMLVEYAGGRGLPRIVAMQDVFYHVCKCDNLTLAQLILEHSRSGPVHYNLCPAGDRTTNRICTKCAPDVACWLYTLDPTLAHWSGSARKRVERLIADRKVSLLRLAWVAAVVRQWKPCV